jgi:hypothetical protein
MSSLENYWILCRIWGSHSGGYGEYYFRDITSCSPLLCLPHAQLQPWRWRRHVTPTPRAAWRYIPEDSALLQPELLYRTCWAHRGVPTQGMMCPRRCSRQKIELMAEWEAEGSREKRERRDKTLRGPHLEDTVVREKWGRRDGNG